MRIHQPSRPCEGKGEVKGFFRKVMDGVKGHPPTPNFLTELGQQPGRRRTCARFRTSRRPTGSPIPRELIQAVRSLRSLSPWHSHRKKRSLYLLLSSSFPEILYSRSCCQRKVFGENIRVKGPPYITEDGAIFAEFISSVHFF